MDHAVLSFISYQLLICRLSDQLIVTSLSKRANISNRCIFSYAPDFVCLPVSLPWGFSCLPVTWSVLFLSPLKQKPLHTANHFYCLHLHIASSLKQGGQVHKMVQGRAGKGCCRAANEESHRPVVPIRATMSPLKQCQDPFHNLLQKKNHTTTEAHNPLHVALRPIHTDRFCRILDVLISLSRNHSVFRREGWASWKSSPFLLLQKKFEEKVQSVG